MNNGLDRIHSAWCDILSQSGIIIAPVASAAHLHPTFPCPHATCIAPPSPSSAPIPTLCPHIRPTYRSTNILICVTDSPNRHSDGTWIYTEGLISVAPIPREYTPITAQETRLIWKLRIICTVLLRWDHKVHAHAVSAYCNAPQHKPSLHQTLGHLFRHDILSSKTKPGRDRDDSGTGSDWSDEMILEKMYSVPVLVFVTVLFIGWYIVSTLAYRSKLSKLGAKPRQVPYYLPFGIDTLIEGIQVLQFRCHSPSVSRHWSRSSILCTIWTSFWR